MVTEKIGTILNNIEYSNIIENKYIEYSINKTSTKRNKKNYSEKAAQQRAMYLADKFENPGGLKFYLKCAWNLTDSYLDWLVEYSFKKKNPTKYFVSVASHRMVENG